MKTQISHVNRNNDHRDGGIFKPVLTAAAISEHFIVAKSKLAVELMKM